MPSTFNTLKRRQFAASASAHIYDKVGNCLRQRTWARLFLFQLVQTYEKVAATRRRCKYKQSSSVWLAKLTLILPSCWNNTKITSVRIFLVPERTFPPFRLRLVLTLECSFSTCSIRSGCCLSFPSGSSHFVFKMYIVLKHCLFSVFLMSDEQRTHRCSKQMTLLIFWTTQNPFTQQVHDTSSTNCPYNCAIRAQWKHQGRYWAQFHAPGHSNLWTVGAKAKTVNRPGFKPQPLLHVLLFSFGCSFPKPLLLFRFSLLSKHNYQQNVWLNASL